MPIGEIHKSGSSAGGSIDYDLSRNSWEYQAEAKQPEITHTMNLVG
ncbi:MAG: hypothetical protein Q4G27_00390 [Flavobacteriaceae bacterium]|nr:hypothetical protein [Flavobacteriaceae bacterium]